jgi:YHS domain-containing protein
VCPPWVGSGEPYLVEIPGFRDPVEVVRLLRLPPGPEPVTDPVCGLLLAPSVALRKIDDDGGPVWFCSESCATAWSGVEAVGEP